MGRNLPDNMSVSDIPTADLPECACCGEQVTSDDTVTAEGIVLCEAHADDDLETVLAHARHRSGIECAVCHTPLLPNETARRDPDLCEQHTVSDLRLKREQEEHIRREDILAARGEEICF